MTVKEFARLVDVAPEDITQWLALMLHVKVIGPSQWSKWTNDTEPISETMVRVYLLWRGLKSDRERQEWLGRVEARRKKREALKPVAAVPEKKRAAGGKR